MTKKSALKAKADKAQAKKDVPVPVPVVPAVREMTEEEVENPPEPLVGLLKYINIYSKNILNK